ncbi:MAG TPA: GerW family sporulation protein [Bacillota bacterium]|nr:sporulation protein YtfJ [Bacillota bacterium]HOB87193.1 GerW family sporulation protein [Bacillota bacterium]HOP69227.1 GerW family sporulation protein [Bacillota bacterium]HPT34255.1 GerW family sporulation protein [Bacillota bacterium]HPZ64233.1 GerW family sporulation protein [Bacillota bacterium]
MEHHPIESLMKTAMENLKEMVDVNKIVGDTVETPDGSVIIPVSRVMFGFAAGGTEFESPAEEKGGRAGNSGGEMPFGGGSGGGVTVQPVAFLVVGQGQVRLLPVDRNAMLDRLIDLTPQVISQIQGMLKRDRYREMPPERSYS